LHIEHGSGFMHLGGPLTTAVGRAYDLTVGRWVLRSASGVAAVSGAGAEFVRRLSGRNVDVIHRGIWTDRLAGASPDAGVLEVARRRPIVSFVGRLIHSKGVEDLVQAFAATRGPEAILCLVGDGPCQANLERLAQRLGVAERVLFLGYLTPSRALAVLSASDVVANPSYTEGLPTAVLEAAGLGRAVLATDVGGTSEIVADGESGMLVAPRDVPALTRRLDELLADPDLRTRLGSAAAARAHREFNWETSAARFVKLARALTGADTALGDRATDQRTAGARAASSNTDS
jgi:glycosyltransferase involved in cell wall biosynthesis